MNTNDGPLAGKRVVVTRPGEAGERLARVLGGLGAHVLVVPAIGFAPPSDPAALEDAARRMIAYDWVVFTSPRAAEAVRDSLSTMDRTWPDGANCAAVGPGTRAVLEAAGARVVVEATVNAAAGVAQALGDVSGHSILMPRSDVADSEVVNRLRAAEALVDEVEAYRTEARVPTGDEMEELRAGYEAVVFASGSAVSGYVQEIRPYVSVAGRPPPVVVCIGPVTAAAARTAGMTVSEVAAEPTDEAVAEAVVMALASGATASPAAAPTPSDRAEDTSPDSGATAGHDTTAPTPDNNGADDAIEQP
jgi:uroporphyrinogen-III synthase